MVTKRETKFRKKKERRRGGRRGESGRRKEGEERDRSFGTHATSRRLNFKGVTSLGKLVL